jgi:hypothetical protein
MGAGARILFDKFQGIDGESSPQTLYHFEDLLQCILVTLCELKRRIHKWSEIDRHVV